jgi:hypothetical protein
LISDGGAYSIAARSWTLRLKDTTAKVLKERYALVARFIFSDPQIQDAREFAIKQELFTAVARYTGASLFSRSALIFMSRLSICYQ